MFTLRKSEDRGHANHGWLESYHTFSFNDYYDPAYMGHSVLRVINEDFIDPSMGFPMHAHRDMEIVTYVIEGELQHKDTLGSIGTISHGEVQQMSAGTGIRHSEYNPNAKNKTHLLQIWLLPDRSGHQPRYEQVDLKEQFKKNDFVLIVSSTGENGSVRINQNAKVYAAKLKEDKIIELPLCSSRNGWLQMITGEVTIDKKKIKSGDAVAISGEEAPKIIVTSGAHFLFFDLP